MAKENRRKEPWTPKEDQYLAKYYKVMSDREIAEELGRTKNAIHSRRNALELYKSEPSDTWTEEEEEIFKAMAVAGYTNKDIANRLGRSYQAIAVRLCNQTEDFKEKVAVQRAGRRKLLKREEDLKRAHREKKEVKRKVEKKGEKSKKSNAQTLYGGWDKRILTRREKRIVREALLKRLDRCGSRRLCDCSHCQEGRRITSVYDLGTRTKVDEWFKENREFLMEG